VTRPLGVLVAAMLIAACPTRADGPPDIVVDRTACSHCGMLISEPIYAAAFQQPDADGRVFDDIGCLLGRLRQASTRPPDDRTDAIAATRFWFRDAAGGGWIAGDRAVFVASPALRTPMGGGVIAFDSQAAAEHTAIIHKGEVVPTLSALMARTGGKL
jgi:copper chaperone NosL